jgi:hypothetical protein
LRVLLAKYKHFEAPMTVGNKFDHKKLKHLNYDEILARAPMYFEAKFRKGAMAEKAQTCKQFSSTVYSHIMEIHSKLGKKDDRGLVKLFLDIDQNSDEVLSLAGVE